MASFPRAALFFLVLLVAFLCSFAITLDVDERQKEKEALESVDKVVNRGAADEAPQPPQNLVVIPQSDTAIMLTWSAPSDTTDFDHYLVYVEDEDMETTTRNLYYIFNNLEPCTDYTFGVMSVSAAGDTSDPLLGEGQTEAGVPPAPQNLQVDGYTSTTVTLSWDKPDTRCDVEEYRVRWSTDGTDTQDTKMSETSFTVTELLKNTTYIFSVFARTSFGEGPEATVQQTTDVIVGGPPENLVAVGVSSSAINVSWSPPADEPDYYWVSAFPCMTMEDSVLGLSYLITDLDPCETCEISVTSLYDDTQKYTAYVRGTTDAEDPPPPESCSVEVEGDGLTVTWNKPFSRCDLGNSRVQWTRTKLWGDGGKESGNGTTSGTRYNVPGAVPYSQYTFEISSSIDGVFGSSASCSGTSSETPDGVPYPPQNLYIDPADTSVVLIWQDPDDTTDLDHYLVYVEEEEDIEYTTDANYCLLQNLEACTNYTFGVMSVSAEGSMSDPLLGEEQTTVGAPPSPQNLQVDGYTSTTVTLSWDKPDTLCDVEEYRVKWSKDDINTEDAITNETSFTVTQLSINTTYTFTVSGFTSYGEGTTVTVQETTAVFDGGPPEDLVAVGVDTSSINVSWSPPWYEPLYYQLTALNCHYFDEIVNGLSFLITGLDPCDSCSIFVTSVYNETFTFTTSTEGYSQGGDPPPPKSCSVKAEQLAITADWESPDSNCQLGIYSVHWTGTKLWGDKEEVSGGRNTSGTEISVLDPVPYSQYSFEISASIDGVFGSAASCTGTSLETQPGAPVIVTVDSVQGEAVVTWETPAEENGVIVNYEIYVDEEPRITVEGDVHTTSLDLDPCETFGLSVMAKNGAGWGPQSEVKDVTIVDDTVLPKKVDCSAGDFNVEVCWDPYDETCPVSRYNLMWEGNVLWSEEIVDVNSTSLDWSDSRKCYNITALPYTKYDVELTVGSGTQSISCSDTTPMAAPGPPADVRLTTQDLTVHVTWTEPEKKNGIIDSYQVIWTTSTGYGDSDSTVDSSTFSYDILGLSCGETVNVMVRAIIKTEEEELNGESSVSQAVHLANSVQTVNCEPSENGQVSLSWTLVDPECPVSSYNVTWVYESLWSDDTGKDSEDVRKDETSFTVPSLPPYSNVLLQVHVDTNPDYTECITVTSQEKSSPPTTLKQTANDSSSVTITWGLPQYIRGELEGWYLRWKKLDDEPIGEETVSEVQRRTYTISELSKSSTYVVYVSAVNGAGNGEEGEINAHTAQVPMENSPNKGLIIGLSAAGGILLIVVLVGSIILCRRRGSSKPPRSSPHMPEIADANSDELYKMQHLSSASQGLHDKHRSVDNATDRELYVSWPSFHIYETINEDGQMPDSPPGRHLSISLPKEEAFNRSSEQVNIKLKIFEEDNSRRSQQDLPGRPSFSGGRDKPSLRESGRRPSQQIDVGRPNLKEYGRRPSQLVDLGQTDKTLKVGSSPQSAEAGMLRVRAERQHVTSALVPGAYMTNLPARRGPRREFRKPAWAGP